MGKKETKVWVNLININIWATHKIKINAGHPPSTTPVTGHSCQWLTAVLDDRRQTELPRTKFKSKLYGGYIYRQH